MQITVKILQGAECQLEVSEDTTVSMLKALVESKLHVPRETQKLVYRGKTLQDDDTMTASKLPAGAKVFLVTMKPSTASASDHSTSAACRAGGQTASSAHGSAGGATATGAVKKEVKAEPGVDRWAPLRVLAERRLGKEMAHRVVTEFQRKLDFHLSCMSMDDIQRYCASGMKEF